MIYPLRALLHWEKATPDRERDILECIQAYPFPHEMSNPVIKWQSRQLTFWRNAERPYFAEITIEYQPDELMADGYSLDTYMWCWRNIKIAPEKLLDLIRKHFCQAVQPLSFKITMSEFGSVTANDSCLMVKSNNWRD